MLDVRRVSAFAVVVSVALPLAAKPTPPAKTTKPAAAPASASSSPEEAEARRHFDTGLKLYKEKLFEAALVEFEQSYSIVPRPSALRNVAQCQRDLKRFAEAYGAYERLLSLHAPQLSAPELAAVKKAIKDLESVTGVITFDVSEVGAAVSVDAREIGQTPLTGPVRVDVGPHVVRVLKTGFEPFEQSVKVLAMQSLTIDAKLVRDVKTGKVTIREKSGAKVHVFVDDIDRGAAPATIDLSPGAHIVELRGDGLFSTRRTIEVAAKTESEHTFEATVLRGRLRVETLGEKGTIYIDDKKMGEGAWEGELSPGAHRVKVEAEGYRRHERLVAVEHGHTVVEAVTLVPLGASGSSPAGPARDPYVGLYGRLALLGGFSLTGSGAEARPVCSDTRPCDIDKSSPMGGGAALHVGYSFGVLAAEFVGAFVADTHQTKRNFSGTPGTPGFPTLSSDPAGTMAREESWNYYSLAGFGGVGGRVTSKDDAVRFTFGIAVGAAYRAAHLKRSTLDDGWKPPHQSYFAPALLADAGLLLGTTPGFKLSIGVNAWVDLPGSDVETEGAPGGRNVSATYGGVLTGAKLESPPQLLRSGPQVYIGPTLGFQFGR